MRRLTLALALVVACKKAAPPLPSTEALYLHDAGFRRSTMDAALSGVDNTYARLRRERLAAWETLPIYNPEPLAISAEATAGDRVALRALGARAFFRYPNQLAPLGAKEGEYGIQHLVPARLADGTVRPAFSCATCHARNGHAGIAHRDLELGALIAKNAEGIAPDRAAAFAKWGKGRVDVTSDEGVEPARIPDLRAVKFQDRLQHSGAVKNHGTASLAFRIETLLIGSHGHALRPPREIALGLAVYLEALGDSLPAPQVGTAGAKVFAAECDTCHEGPGLSGGLTAIKDVGTDPALALSKDRGTGRYRIPSLRGVGSRGPLLHDGSVANLEELLSATRGGGHRFGVDLDAPSRAALLAFLAAL